MNNIGRTPTCGVHYTYKICLLDSISLTGIADWIGNPTNTTKERKKRANKRTVRKIDKDHIIKIIHNISGGAICAGEKCLKNLWLYQGKSEYDSTLGLQYCSEQCKSSRNYTNISCLQEEKIKIWAI